MFPFFFITIERQSKCNYCYRCQNSKLHNNYTERKYKQNPFYKRKLHSHNIIKWLCTSLWYQRSFTTNGNRKPNRNKTSFSIQTKIQYSRNNGFKNFSEKWLFHSQYDKRNCERFHVSEFRECERMGFHGVKIYYYIDFISCCFSCSTRISTWKVDIYKIKFCFRFWILFCFSFFLLILQSLIFSSNVSQTIISLISFMPLTWTFRSFEYTYSFHINKNSREK